MLSIVLAVLIGFTQASVADLQWLTGCWAFTASARTVTEHWMRPDGGTMLGMSRTIRDGKTVEYEFIVVRAGDRGLEYVAHPSGQTSAVFTATRIAPGEAVFENPAHDFPTRITYRKVDGGILATVDGMVNGQRRAIEFQYAAADCQR